MHFVIAVLFGFSAQDYEQKLRPPTMEFLPQGRGPRRLCSRVRLISDGQAESSPEYFVVILSLIYTERVFITPERAYVLIYDVGCESRVIKMILLLSIVKSK